MNTSNTEKNFRRQYKTPVFQMIRPSEQAGVFFVASSPALTVTAGALPSYTENTGNQWNF